MAPMDFRPTRTSRSSPEKELKRDVDGVRFFMLPSGTNGTKWLKNPSRIAGPPCLEVSKISAPTLQKATPFGPVLDPKMMENHGKCAVPMPKWRRGTPSKACERRFRAAAR